MSRGDFLATTKAGQRAVNKYIKNNYDRILLTTIKGGKETLQAVADKRGKSVNAYIKEALKAQIKADTGQDVRL